MVGYGYNDLWPDEIIVTRDAVFGYAGTLQAAGLSPERDDATTSAVIRLARELWPSACRPDGRLFYTIAPETNEERAARGLDIKAQVKRGVEAVRAGQKRDAAKAAGVIEMF